LASHTDEELHGLAQKLVAAKRLLGAAENERDQFLAANQNLPQRQDSVRTRRLRLIDKCFGEVQPS
jgi:hypothetical protein